MAETRQKKRREKREAVETAILHVGLVVDMSGSMGRVHQATIEGVNEYIQGLQEEAGEGKPTNLSLTCFDTVFENWLVEEPVENVSPSLMIDNYQPRGGTALYDAIARTITEMDARIGGSTTMEARSADEKCMVIIFTDGQENSSQEYSLQDNGAARLAALIKAYEDRGNWTFIYMSAGHADLGSTQSYASKIGVPTGNTAYYASTPDSVHATSSALSSVTRTRRASAAGQSVESFSDSGLGQDYSEPEKPEKTSSESINKLLGSE